MFLEILQRYHAAAQKLRDAPPQLGNEDQDADATALDGLLRQQASSLMKWHNELLVADSSCHNVNKTLVRQRLRDLASICLSKLYAYRFDLVPYHWRQMYTDTLILTTFHDILDARQESRDITLDTVVETLDRAIITAGGAGVLGSAWIEGTLQLLERLDSEQPQQPAAAAGTKFDVVAYFPTDEQQPCSQPSLSQDKLCPRRQGWSLARFEDYMNAATPPRPLLFTDLMDSWPALTSRPWKSPAYLLSKTFGGRRLVPVEVGRSYVDDGWGQELVPFSRFLTKYLLDPTSSQLVGYLAQHNLFHQIPSLRRDIAVPDYCWAEVPGHPDDPGKDRPRLDQPQLNAWFGPAGTITPLHTDAYHNLLAQVVGKKYVRLYPPGKDLCARGVEDGVDMSNTSTLDLGVLMGWDGGQDLDEDERRERRARRRVLDEGEYWECVLTEGDTLLIPMGWWHYVRSLTVSFSVSFWWN